MRNPVQDTVSAGVNGTYDDYETNFVSRLIYPDTRRNFSYFRLDAA